MLRVPSSTLSSRFLYSRLSQTLIALPWRPLSWPMRMPSGWKPLAPKGRVRPWPRRPSLPSSSPSPCSRCCFMLLGERLHQLVEAAHLLDHLLFLFGEEFVGQGLQPFGGDVGGSHVGELFQPLEHMAEHLVETVEVLLVLHQGRAGQVVEVVDRLIDHVAVERLHEHEVLFQGDRHLGLTQLGKEVHEHGRTPWRLEQTFGAEIGRKGRVCPEAIAGCGRAERLPSPLAGEGNPIPAAAE